MTRNLLAVFYKVFVILLLVSSCKSNTNQTYSIATDSISIASGKKIFDKQCSSCHNFRQDGIGPQLSSITVQTSADWIKKFISNPKQMIESGDEKAKMIFAAYHTTMPSFPSLSENDLNGLVSFLNTHKTLSKNNKKPINKLITTQIHPSEIVVGLQLFTQMPFTSKTSPFTRIVKMDYEPNTDNFYMLELRGKLYRLIKNNPIAYLDIAKFKPKFINEPGLATGFGSFAFHPDFARNGIFYTTHTEPAGTKKADFNYADSIKVALQWVLTEWKTSNISDSIFKGTNREILRVDMISGIHGVQEISFNPFSKKGDEDYGQLYIGVGDGGIVENGHPEYAHSLQKIWGTILRIYPAGKNGINGQYGIPKNNPFANAKDNKIRKEIYAYGFRNPNHISWSSSKLMIVSNIGQANIESLNIIIAGHDYGWPIREGTFSLDPKGDLNQVNPLLKNDSAAHITYPAAQYDHNEGKAIAGGFDYVGKLVPQLKGKYIFGDIVSGRLFYVNMNEMKMGSQAQINEWKISLNGKLVKLTDVCGSDRVDLRFGRDRHGEMFLFTKADGKVYRLMK